jgi:paired box protein 6
MHGHATAIGQTSLFGCSSAGHSGINQLGGVYVNGELHKASLPGAH